MPIPTCRVPRWAAFQTALACALLTVLACGRSTSPTSAGGPTPVAAVGVSPPSASVQAGTSLQLTATPQDATGQPLSGRVVTWSSDAMAFATVNGSGLVTGLAPGPVTITATSEGKTGTSDITVVDVPVVRVASVTVTPASASVDAGSTVQLTATPKDASGAPLPGRAVTWSSDAMAFATVNGSGLVTGVAAGPATITATSEGKTGTSAITVTPHTSGTLSFGHVFIVVEENTDYADVIGNTSMPYVNGLASQYGSATQYYANTHPSLPNYFMITVGNLVASDNSYSGTVTDDNIVREVLVAGKTWKCYAEGLPSVGYMGDAPDPYTRHHNPFTYLSDVVNDPVQQQNVVPFTQFATDLAGDRLPNYGFIVPNKDNDAHDGSLATADDWLARNIDPLIHSATFQADGLLIIVFDESKNDYTNGGGRVVCVNVSAKSKPAYQSATLYQHQSTLRLAVKALGLPGLPGTAATAPDMSEFFTP